MEAEKVIGNLRTGIDCVLNKVPINYVVCKSTKAEIEGWTFKKYEKYLKGDSNHKIEVNTAFFLNDFSETGLSAQYIDDALHREIELFEKTFIDELNVIISKGEYFSEINDLFMELFSKIDAAISKLNFYTWLEENGVNNKENILWLLIGRERRTYRGIFFDVVTNCKRDFEYAFKLRINVLRDIKYYLVDVYSNFFVGPLYGSLPKLVIHPSKADISGLINALCDPNFFENAEDLRSVLLQLFNLTGKDYRTYIHEFTERKRIATKFHQKFIKSFLPKESCIIEWREKNEFK